jgi:hypothetical protein
MTRTGTVLMQMFQSMAKLSVDPQIVDQMAAVVDALVERLKRRVDLDSEEDWNHLRVAFCGMMAHGWVLGMNPYNNPDTRTGGEPVEVRVSRDILAPMDVIKSIRYVKKDAAGRIRQALFEPSPAARFREQIDRLLDDIARKSWDEE